MFDVEAEMRNNSIAQKVTMGPHYNERLSLGKVLVLVEENRPPVDTQYSRPRTIGFHETRTLDRLRLSSKFHSRYGLWMTRKSPRI
jgi:hypothetical protein